MLTHGLLALCVALMPAIAAPAATWTYTPELRRLDADGNELPAGQIDLERDGILRAGLYVTVSADGAVPSGEAVLGFESFLGAIHFSSDEMGAADIAAVVRSLREGRGWERRLATLPSNPPRTAGSVRQRKTSTRRAGSRSGPIRPTRRASIAGRGARRTAAPAASSSVS